MDEEYDVVVCGTGLKECIMSGLLSVSGKKVLHVDRNSYYGGEGASLNLTHLYEKFRQGANPPAALGSNRDWNVDLIPKLVMANGDIVRILLKSKVTRYLEWKSVEGTYVYQYQAAGMFSGAKYIHKVPATDMEALKSPLMGLLEKNRCKNFFQFVAEFDFNNRATWLDVDPRRHSMRQLYEKFGLQQDTIDFMGHAVALYTDDGYLDRACGPTLERMKLYMTSILRFGKSPFIYPLYGLGTLPEGFSRLSAIHGGTYMLNTSVEFLFSEESGTRRVCGVKTDHGIAKCKTVICDPSYVKDTLPLKIRKVGTIIRVICVLSAPIPSTNDATSCQIIIPQRQLKRRSDIFIMMVSNEHQVSPAGKYLALVSAMVETPNPAQEIQPAMELLGPILEKFVSISDLYEPVAPNGMDDGIFVSKSMDAVSHFESEADDVKSMWKHIMGEELSLDIPPDALGHEDQ